MNTAFRSVFVVNRSSLLGTAAIVVLATALLTATGSWIEAAFRDDRLALLLSLGGSFAGIVIMITVFLVASIFSGALAQRRREFALLRAVGATSVQVRSTVTSEAVAVLVVASPVGAVIGILIAPLLTPLLRAGVDLPADFVLPFSALSIVAALIVIVPTALIAAQSAARGILRVSPTVAVRESSADSPTISRGRIQVAVGLAIVGLLSATTPFFIPGVIGSATGGVSAILLIIAAALAGPAIVRRAATKSLALVGTSTGVGRVLAFANARGFSRRLSSAIVPLALLVALGSVQSGVNIAIAESTVKELQASIQSDLVVYSPSGITPAQADAVAAAPGVTATTATGHQRAAVLLDAEDGWEQVSVTTITPGDSLVDPTVTSGLLSDLDAPGTIAANSTALLFTGKGLGDTITVRVDGGEPTAATIVAIYERGLSFGDYAIGSGDLAAASDAPAFDAVYVNATDPADAATLASLADLGLTVSDSAGYAESVSKGGGGEQTLSLVLLIALLGFVAAAAANNLAMSTASRRDEFTLLKRIGATRAQVMRMVTIETIFIIVTAIGIGILSVLPALFGAGQGLLGVPLPVFDLPVTGTLAAATVIITILTVIPTAWRATASRAEGRAE